MHPNHPICRSLLIATGGIVLIATGFVSSDDQKRIQDQRPTLAPEQAAAPLDEPRLETISEIRASHAPEFLRDEDSVQVFREALKAEALNERDEFIDPEDIDPEDIDPEDIDPEDIDPEDIDYEQDVDTDPRSSPQPLPASAIATDNDVELVESLLKSAALLNWRANLLEKEDHLAADKCRNLSERLRLEARSIRSQSE